MNDTSKTIAYEWVAARYTGEKAKYVASLAREGVGYQILDQPDTGLAWIDVAFRRPIVGPRPEHLELIVSSHAIDKLEERYLQRSGAPVLA
jgi:hypothetical protein